jgi:hypothetical protein
MIPRLRPRAAASLSAALALAAAPLASRSAEPSPLLEGCQRAPTVGGVQFLCGDLLVSVSDMPGVSAKETVPTVLAGIRSAVQGEVTTGEISFTAGGRTWPGTQISVRGPDGKVGYEGVLIAFDSGGGATRIVQCGSKPGGAATERCPLLVPALADSGPAPYAVAPGEPRFLGRKVAVPKGCQTLEANDMGFRIACADGGFAAHVRLGRPEDMAKFVAALNEQLVRSIPGAAERPERACRIGGAKARCKVIAARNGAERFVFLVGAAQVKGVPVSVQCGQPEGRKGVHPVCAGLIGW